MKILIVSQYFYPEQFRINDICSELVRRGHCVTVLTGLPNYPDGEIYPQYRNMGNKEEIVFGARVIRCKIRPRHKGTKNLVLNYLSFVRQANKKIKRIGEDFDIVYVYGISPVTQALPAIRYKKAVNKSVKIVYYCCDLWPEAVRGEQNGHKQLSMRHPIYLVAKYITRSIYRKIDLLINKCDDFISYNKRICGVCENKQLTIFEHAEDTYLNVFPLPIQNGCIDFVFLGNLGGVQNCRLAILAATRLKPTNPFKIHFVGGGSELKNLIDFSEKNNLTDVVIFHGQVSKEEVNQFYNMADVCLLLLSHRTETGLTIPGKLTSYMAAARPIVASVDGSSKTIIEKTNCGFVCPADDIDGLVDIMQKVIDNPSLVDGMGSNGRKGFIEHFTLKHHLDMLENVFYSLRGNEA